VRSSARMCCGLEVACDRPCARGAVAIVDQARYAKIIS
jgi:hypothetical protein